MANQIDHDYLSWLKLLRWTRLDFFFKTSFLLNFHLICMSALLDHENCRLQMDKTHKITKKFRNRSENWQTFHNSKIILLYLVNLQQFPFPVVALFHIQNSSNSCRHNNDPSISRVFDFIYFFLFPGLWLSQNWPNKCLTPKTWWPLAIPVTVGTWLWPPFSEAACPWRRLTNKCWTSKTRTGKFSIKICYNLFLVKSQRVQSTLCILTRKLNKIIMILMQCMLCNSWWLVVTPKEIH